MKQVCLAMTLLALAVILSDSAPAQTQPVFDHYLCYFAPNQPVLQIPFQLQDQFDGSSFEQMNQVQIMRLCNPVQKVLRNSAGNITATFPIINPAGHLTLWQFSPQPIIPRQVLYTNQFGAQQTLFTSDPRVLATPTSKVFPSSTAPPPPPPTNLDHYKCYVASGPNAHATVWLTDQFINNVPFNVVQPVLFCNPTVKVRPSPSGVTTTTPIQFPNEHLTCYAITPITFAAAVDIRNQFVTVNGLRVNNPDMLCAPTTKLRWNVVPPPPSPAP